MYVVMGGKILCAGPADFQDALVSHDERERLYNSMSILPLQPTTSYQEDREQARYNKPLRFLLYCHDTYGLGHLRRTLALAAHFTRTLPHAQVLIVTGAPLAHAFTLPPRVDYVKLPAVTKQQNGTYTARSLNIDFLTLRDLRATLLRETALAYQPDVFLVDHAPQGMKREVLPTLTMLRAQMPHCLRVLGLRDIIDDGNSVRHTWQQEGIYHTLATGYDLILVYGSQAFYDVAQEYQLPSSIPVRYCGYLDHTFTGAEPSEQLPTITRSPSEQPLVVVTAGGGGDGFPLLYTYLSGLQTVAEPPMKSIVITGPLMHEDEQRTLHALAASLPEDTVQIKVFVADSIALFRSADLVVSMAGYNTTSELLALRQRMLLVPRTIPRLEQYERATRLAQYGLAQFISPDELTPAYLLSCVQHALHLPRPQSTYLDAAGIAFEGQQMALETILDELHSSRESLQYEAAFPMTASIL